MRLIRVLNQEDPCMGVSRADAGIAHHVHLLRPALRPFFRSLTERPEPYGVHKLASLIYFSITRKRFLIVADYLLVASDDSTNVDYTRPCWAEGVLNVVHLPTMYPPVKAEAQPDFPSCSYVPHKSLYSISNDIHVIDMRRATFAYTAEAACLGPATEQ